MATIDLGTGIDDGRRAGDEVPMERMPEPWQAPTTPEESHGHMSDGSHVEDNMVNVANIEPVPPNGGYGWVCAVGLFLINAHTWGVNSVSLPQTHKFLLYMSNVKLQTVMGCHHGTFPITLK